MNRSRGVGPSERPTPPLVLGPEVSRGRAEGRAIVALESTLLAHGLPWPRGLEAALAMEDEIRQRGAVPATIAVLRGQIQVGLGQADLEWVARSAPPKASSRDLAIHLARSTSATTTVAGTLVAMARAGLSVFATGGIGGVHRGVEASFDISADLPALARAQALVVCAGAKAILDLPRTLELLETLGVPVLGYRTDELPAFITRGSGLPVSARVETADEAARVAAAHWQVAGGGVLLAAPIPEAWSVPEREVQAAIEDALERAEGEGVRGAAVTPFLLHAVAEHTDGRSTEANLALLRNNAGLAADVAIELQKER